MAHGGCTRYGVPRRNRERDGWKFSEFAPNRRLSVEAASGVEAGGSFVSAATGPSNSSDDGECKYELRLPDELFPQQNLMHHAIRAG
jgi:hypothetical protein